MRGRGERRGVSGRERIAIAIAAISLAASSAPAVAADRAVEPRIVGGTTTTIAEWPWQVAVAQSQSAQPGEQDGFQRQFCGGSLVAPTLVVTAAHCVYDFGDPTGTTCVPVLAGFDVPADQLAVFTGRTVLSSNEGQEIAVAEIYYFVNGPGGTPASEAQSEPGQGDELFDCQTLAWDVALLELASASTSTPIQIAGADERATWTAGTPAFITGWGDTTNGQGSFPDNLREAEVEIVADADCASPNSYGSSFDPETMLCAGLYPEGGRDTCAGDSGGPLVVGAELAGAIGHRLVGDTSFGNECAAPDFPGVYGRIADDPMRSALAAAAQQIAAVNIVGSGARALAPPQTEIGKHPRKRVRTKRRRVRVRFTFSASEPASFACGLDGRTPKPCSTPYSRRVGRGPHRLEIVATDEAGQRDPTPAIFRWKVKRRR